MDEPRWLVDEMLGRLVRYLRFLGYDAEYVRGITDDEIVERARVDQRRVITRDRSLARRLPDAVLLTRTDIAGQMRELRTAFPALRADVRFDRCSICNGRLSILEKVPSQGPGLDALPPTCVRAAFRSTHVSSAATSTGRDPTRGPCGPDWRSGFRRSR